MPAVNAKRYIVKPFFVLSAVLVALMAVATADAPAATARFKDGPAVARAMERHYNSSEYKTRLAKNGGRVSGRVLCAHDDLLDRVECTGHLIVLGKRVKAKWELEKRTARRARLSWIYSAAGVLEGDDEIVAPSAFELTRF